MKKIIDEKGRLFGRISIIDFVAILVLLAVAGALVYKYTADTALNRKSVPIVFEGLVQGMQPYMVESIQVGDIVYDHDQETGGPIGVITNIEYTPSITFTTTSTGEPVYPINLDYQDLTITIEAVGTVEDGHYLINNVYEVGVNAFRNFYTTYSGFSLAIMEFH